MTENQIRKSPEASRDTGSPDRFAKTGIPAPVRNNTILPLTAVRPGQEGRIVTIRGDDTIVRRLSDLGLTPGTSVSVWSKTPMGGPVEISVRRTRLALDHAIAGTICIGLPLEGEP